jgi:hypothetical protein
MKCLNLFGLLLLLAPLATVPATAKPNIRTPDMGRLSPMFFRISVFRPFRKR